MGKVRCLAVVLALLGCGGDSGNGDMMNPLAGAGAGGVPTAGAGVGAAGMGAAGVGVAGTGAAGMGVAGTGAAGMGAAGMGMAGMGAAGMGGGDSVPGCSAADTSVTGSAAHAGAVEVLAAASPCGFSSCHQGPTGKADLVLTNEMDLRTLLVGVNSCQVPAIPLVADGGGDTALDNSWLWIKLTAPSDPSGVITGDPAWGTAVNCGQMGNQPYGLRMPWSNTDALVDDERLAKVRNWICAGAPGP